MPKQAVPPELIAQLLADPAQATCPSCGATGFYDNRTSKRGVGKGPVFACKNKDECDTGNGYPYGVFARDLKSADVAPAAKNGATPSAVKHPVSWKQLKVAYAECVGLALKGAAQIGKTGVPIQPEHVTTMVNSLMMTRERTNCWPPVATVPAKAAVPARDERPYDADATEDDDLPF